MDSVLHSVLLLICLFVYQSAYRHICLVVFPQVLELKSALEERDASRGAAANLEYIAVPYTVVTLLGMGVHGREWNLLSTYVAGSERSWSVDWKRRYVS